jgi:toluene monooxygenase system protein E
MSRQRTYWHLEGKKRWPTAYEIATSRLLYYTRTGFEVDVPVAPWYQKYQQGSRFTCSDWEQFSDPRETTYTKYVVLQKGQEDHIDLLYSQEPLASLDEHWHALLQEALPPLRFVGHGLQMLAAYVGQMAPASRITIAAGFQAADEARRIQRLAWFTRRMQELDRNFGQDSKERWTQDPRWQPLRRLMEQLLVTYDWGEALVALNLAVKPILDELFMQRLAIRARQQGDFCLSRMLLSLYEDCLWHQSWAMALVDLVSRDNKDADAFIKTCRSQWQAAAHEAIDPLQSLFAGADA